jgi:hypothetical protein
LILTEGYIKGYEDCLTSIIQTIEKIVDAKIGQESDFDALIKAFNELLQGIYSKTDVLYELIEALEEQEANAPDCFEDDAYDGKPMLTLLLTK